MSLSNELSIALELAREAGRVQMETLKSLDKGMRMKGDRSPVTEVDIRCEKLLRTGLERAFPEDGFLGEESDEKTTGNGRTWIVDPIDGTRPYIRGIPTFSVLVSLEDAGVPVVGVIHLPALGETYWATRGGGAFLNGDKIRTSPIADLDRAMGAALGFTQMLESDLGKKTVELLAKADYPYGFMDAASYGYLASGRLDFTVNLLDKPWDLSAAACIIREAGGRFTDLKGVEDTRSGGSIFTNGHLHPALLRELGIGS